MSVKMILTVCFLSLIALSCSNDEGITEEEMNRPVDEALYTNALFQVSLSGDGTATKTGMDTEAPIPSEYAINNCFIAVINKATGEVLGSSWFGQADLVPGSDQATAFNKPFSVKVPDSKPELNFLAIANLSESAKEGEVTSADKLLSYTKKEEFDQFLLENEDPTVLVKIGNASILNYTTVANPGDPSSESNPVIIPVRQCAAAFMLESIETTGGVAVSVTSLQMLNVKLASYLNKEYVFTENEENLIKYYGDSKVKTGLYDQIRFYGYANSSVDTRTSMKINYTINNVSYSRTFTIKDGLNERVLAGRLYKLSVTIGADKVEGYFKMQDWILNKLGVGEIIPDRD